MCTRTRAFTLIELLVVISIIALLVGILLPALGAARRTAKMALNGNNLRQLAIAVNSYAADNDGWMPPSINFTGTPASPTWAQPIWVNYYANAAANIANASGQDQRSVLNNGGALGLYLYSYLPESKVFTSPFIDRDPTSIEKLYPEADTQYLASSYFMLWGYGGLPDDDDVDYVPPASIDDRDNLITSNYLRYDHVTDGISCTLPFDGGQYFDSGTVPRFRLVNPLPIEAPDITAHAGYKDGSVQTWNTRSESIEIKQSQGGVMWLPEEN